MVLKLTHVSRQPQCLRSIPAFGFHIFVLPFGVLTHSHLFLSAWAVHENHTCRPSLHFLWLMKLARTHNLSLSLSTSLFQSSLSLPPLKTSPVDRHCHSNPFWPPHIQKVPPSYLTCQFGAPPSVKQLYCCHKVIFHSTGLTKGEPK